MNASQIEREDVMMFINACFACTGQSEFYASSAEQRLSIGFLHDYIHGNYPRLYRLCLAAGINDFNRAEIVRRLLAAGAPARADERAREGQLIAAALRDMRPQRVYKLFEQLRQLRINNRRTRAVIRTWLAGRDAAFDAVKYRNRLRAVLRHAHLRTARFAGCDEIGPFVFDGPHSRKSWDRPLLESYRRAWYDQKAIYELPYSIAEGLASRRGIPRKQFLERIESRMTAGERLRLEQSRQRSGAALADVDLARMPLTKLALYVLSRPLAERARPRPASGDRAGQPTVASRHEPYLDALRGAAGRVARRAPMELGRVCAILDCSFSSRGSSHKRNRPLGVALAANFLLEAMTGEYYPMWTGPVRDPLAVIARGQSNLARPLISALRQQPDLIVIVSDGFDNDPPGAVAEVLRIYHQRIAPGLAAPPAIVHINPVFDSDEFMPRGFGPGVPVVGVRDAEDLPTALGFARFADGSLSLAELESYLDRRADAVLARYRQRSRTSGKAAAKPSAGPTDESTDKPSDTIDAA